MCKGLTKSPPILQPLSQKTSHCWAPPPMTCQQEWCSLREYRADRESRVVDTAPQSQPLCHGRKLDIRNFNLFIAVGAPADLLMPPVSAEPPPRPSRDRQSCTAAVTNDAHMLNNVCFDYGTSLKNGHAADPEASFTHRAVSRRCRCVANR